MKLGLKVYKHWKIFCGKVCLTLWCDYATLLTLGTMGDTTQVVSFLFVSHCLIRPSQIGVIKISTICVVITINFANVTKPKAVLALAKLLGTMTPHLPWLPWLTQHK
jgi:hypothetical protein